MRRWCEKSETEVRRGCSPLSAPLIVPGVKGVQKGARGCDGSIKGCEGVTTGAKRFAYLYLYLSRYLVRRGFEGGAKMGEPLAVPIVVYIGLYLMKRREVGEKGVHTFICTLMVLDLKVV